MRKIASAGIAVAAAAAAIAWGIWLGLPSRAPSPPAEPAAPSGGLRILRVLDGESGAPALGAWVGFVAKGESEPDKEFGAAWTSGGTGDIVRIPLTTIESPRWDRIVICALDRPALEIPAQMFRTLIYTESQDAWVSLASEEIDGRVVDGDGNPNWGVVVSARGTVAGGGRRTHPALERRELAWSFEGYTDQEGRFRIRYMPGEGAGRPSIEFVKQGYLPASPKMPLGANAVVTLFEEAHVAGFVRDSARSPIEGATIEARPAVAGAGPDAISPIVKGISSGRDGSFEIRLAGRIRYRVVAGAPGYEPSEVKDYCPADGAHLDIELHTKMELEPRSIRLLSGEPPAPVGGILAHVFSPIKSGDVAHLGMTDGEGRIRVVIPPGEVGHEIVFVAPGVGFGQLEVLPAEDRDRQAWDVVLQGGHDLDLSFVDSAGSPVEGIEVALSAPRPEPEPSDSEIDEILRGLFSVYSLFTMEARSDASGQVAFRHLPADLYTLSLTIPYESEFFPDPKSPWLEDVQLRLPCESPITIRLLRAARILGKIIDPKGEPLRDAYCGDVEVFSELESIDVRTSETGEDGRFHIEILNVPESSEGDAGRVIGGIRFTVYHKQFAEKTFVVRRVPSAGETIDVGSIALDPFATLIVQFPISPIPKGVGYPHLYRDVGGTDPDWIQVEHPRLSRDEDRLYCQCLAPGTYRVEAFVGDHVPSPWESDPIPIGPGETRTITAAIERGLVLFGRVIDDETDAPIEQAEVSVWHPECRGQDRTNYEGRFRIGGLRPGPAELSVSRPGYSHVHVWVDTSANLPEPIRMARIPEPPGTSARRAAPPPAKIAAEEGEPPGPAMLPLVLAVERPNGLLLRQRETCIVEIEGSDLRCETRSSDDLGLRRTSIPADRASRFRVWGDAYLPSAWMELPKLGAETIEPMRGRLQEGPRLRVVVRRSDGGPVENACVVIGYAPVPGAACDRGTSDANGEVALRPLPPGPVDIDLSGPAIVRGSARCEYDGRGGPIPVVALRPAALECSLRYGQGAVRVRAELGELSDLEMWQSFASRHLPRVRGIPPGTHELRILNASTGLLYARRTLTFADGETLSVEIDLPMGSIEGRVSLVHSGRPAGRPPKWLRVETRPLGISGSDEAKSDVGNVDRNGRFAFRGLPPGRYRIEWPEGDGLGPNLDVEVRDGETAQVDWEVRTWTLRGAVLSSDGSQIRRAKVGLEPHPFRDEPTYDVWPTGRFTICEVAEGRQTLIITAPGFVPYRQVIDMDRDRTIDVVIEKGVPVPVTVAAPDGEGPAARAFWRGADGATGFAGFVEANGTVFVPSAAVSLRVETESGASVDVPLVRAEGGGYAPVRAVIPSGEGR